MRRTNAGRIVESVIIAARVSEIISDGTLRNWKETLRSSADMRGFCRDKELTPPADDRRTKVGLDPSILLALALHVILREASVHWVRGIGSETRTLVVRSKEHPYLGESDEYSQEPYQLTGPPRGVRGPSHSMNWP